MHLNCSIIARHGQDLTSYLDHLKVHFDIIMLTESRQTTVGIVESYFPEYEVFLENLDTIKGGPASWLEKIHSKM